MNNKEQIMNNKIKIEKNIPIPERGTRRGLITSTLKLLSVGDSVVLPIKPTSVHSCARIVGIKVAARKISDTEVRIWRIA